MFGLVCLLLWVCFAICKYLLGSKSRFSKLDNNNNNSNNTQLADSLKQFPVQLILRTQSVLILIIYVSIFHTEAFNQYFCVAGRIMIFVYLLTNLNRFFSLPHSSNAYSLSQSSSVIIELFKSLFSYDGMFFLLVFCIWWWCITY